MSLDEDVLFGIPPVLWGGSQRVWNSKIYGWQFWPEGSLHKRLHDSFTQEVLGPIRRTSEVRMAGYCRVFMVSGFGRGRFVNIEASVTSASNLERYVRELL